MTYSTKATVVRGAVLAAASLLVAAPSASAGAVPRDASSGTWLYLTVTRGDVLPPDPGTVRARGVTGRDTRSTLLLCDPPQGHSHAAGACAELDAADGDIGSIPAKEDVVCPMIYAPVTARARGEWQGRPVMYEETFSNTCTMAARTGEVFALDG